MTVERDLENRVCELEAREVQTTARERAGTRTNTINIAVRTRINAARMLLVTTAGRRGGVGLILRFCAGRLGF